RRPVSAPASAPCFACPYCHHRPLHSFPTRRSSDLGGVGEREAHPQSADQDARPRARVPSSCGVGRVQRLQRGVDEEPLRAPVGGDRKSTRLNSSHVKISYAVFCLKKKKNTQHPWTR